MDERLIDMSVKFTEVYKANINEHKAIREMKCYSVLFPELLGQVNEDDTFVGNVGYGTGEYYIPIDVVPKKINQIGYCMHLDSFEKLKNDISELGKKIASLRINIINIRKMDANSKKVIDAFHEYSFSESDLNQTVGYGYNDQGRDKIERILLNLLSNSIKNTCNKKNPMLQ